MTTQMGEGAISSGPMVPVYQVRDPEKIRRALEVLDSAHVPALLADDVPGLLMAPVPAEVGVIVVPLRLLEAAKVALRREGLLAASDPAPSASPAASVGLAAGSVGSSVGESRPASLRPVPFAVRRPSVADAPEDPDEPIETPLYEASPVQTRLIVALAGCAMGAVLQASLLVGGGGLSELRRFLALRWDGTTFAGNPITAGFVHNSTTHFFSNLAFGLVLGTVLLGTHGVGATALVWLCASVVGIVAEAYLSPNVFVLGASAGIYGLVGLWLRGELRRAGRAALPWRARIRAAGVILLLAPGALSPVSSSGSQVAVLAHLVGFGVGLMSGGLFPRWLDERDRERGERRGRWALGVSGVVTAIGMMAAFLAVQ